MSDLEKQKSKIHNRGMRLIFVGQCCVKEKKAICIKK